jgi:hypothetical protein
MVRTSGFHPENRGSIPRGAMKMVVTSNDELFHFWGIEGVESTRKVTCVAFRGTRRVTRCRLLGDRDTQHLVLGFVRPRLFKEERSLCCRHCGATGEKDSPWGYLKYKITMLNFAYRLIASMSLEC